MSKGKENGAKPTVDGTARGVARDISEMLRRGIPITPEVARIADTVREVDERTLQPRRK